MIVSTYFENGKFAGNFSSEDIVPEGHLIATKIYPENLIDGYYNVENNEWYENASNANKIELAIQIDLQYTKLISDLMRKHIEKYAIDGVEIPTNIIEQRNALRN